jgi:hypothetical protein
MDEVAVIEQDDLLPGNFPLIFDPGAYLGKGSGKGLAGKPVGGEECTVYIRCDGNLDLSGCLLGL